MLSTANFCDVAPAGKDYATKRKNRALKDLAGSDGTPLLHTAV